MTAVQEIKITTSKGNFVVEVDKGCKFSISPIDYPNDWMLENNKIFDSVDDCFENVISGIKTYCDKNKISIYDIDNPCNCELISADKQKEICKKIGMPILVKINGNIR